MRLELSDAAAVLLPYLTAQPQLVQMLQDNNVFEVRDNIKNPNTEQISINRKIIKSETKFATSAAL